MGRAGLCLSGLLLVSACGPMDLDLAERECLPKAQLAQHPRGQISVGYGSGSGVGVGVGLAFSSDYLQHRDPDQVFADCVQQRAGQPPSRSFSSRPESRM